MPFQSRSGSAHCEVIFCSYCAVRADWPMHGFSAHFQNAHARITFRKSFVFTCPRIRFSRRITIQNTLFFAFQKPDLKQLCVHIHGLKSGFQIRKGPNYVLKRLSEHDSSPCEHSHYVTGSYDFMCTCTWFPSKHMLIHSSDYYVFNH